MVSIHAQDENDFIKSLAPSGEEQWIGLTNHNSRSNQFKWIDRSVIGNFEPNWAVGEPNCATVDEDCVAMKPDGKWIDVACRKQRIESDTPFDTRGFTCKTSGKKRPLLLYPETKLGYAVTRNKSVETSYETANYLIPLYNSRRILLLKCRMLCYSPAFGHVRPNNLLIP